MMVPLTHQRKVRDHCHSFMIVINQMAETNPKVAALKPEQFIDGRFFAAMEKEGFLQKLWK